MILILGVLAMPSCKKEEIAKAPEAPPPPAQKITHTAIDESVANTVSQPAAKKPAAEIPNLVPEPLPRSAPDPAPAAAAGGLPTAKAVNGKPGFVFSPYNDKVVDVRDMPPGTLVADPTFPPSEKKYFRTP